MGEFFETGRAHVAYFMQDKIAELRFRLSELLDLMGESRRRFDAGEPAEEGSGKSVRYAFSAYLSLVQTLKDALEQVTAEKVTWADLSSVRHLGFMQDARNAATHDGNPMLSLWADGRYYVACDFNRRGQFGKTVLVEAPAADMETVCREFSFDFAAAMKSRIAPMLGDPALSGPVYGREFIRLVMSHPALPEFAKQQMDAALETTWPEFAEDRATKIIEEIEVLSSRAQLGAEYFVRHEPGLSR